VKNEEIRMEEWRGKNREGSVAGVFAMLNYFWDERKSRDTHEDVTALY
jgi:hypothetical protein